MTGAQPISLQSGQHADLVVKTSSEIHCVSGRIHVALQRMGIGWSMHPGDACLLRSDAQYRVTAQTKMQMIIQPAR